MVIEAHRPGAFKQQNKTHKTGRHRSNSKINKDAKGYICIIIFTLKMGDKTSSIFFPNDILCFIIF